MKAHAIYTALLYIASCLVAATLCIGIAHASGPIGVYALVDKVTFEPNSDKPEHVRISGIFIAAEETPDNSTVYSAPQRGYPISSCRKATRNSPGGNGQI
jgi:hypothetical protein